MKNSITLCALLTGLLIHAGVQASGAENYTLNYSGIDCIEDTAYSAGDWDAFGFYNPTGDPTLIWCPINYIEELQVDGTTNNFNPHGGNVSSSAVYMYVVQPDESYPFQCYLIANDGEDDDDDRWFDYEFMSPSTWSSGGPSKTLYWAPHSGFVEEADYMHILCLVPPASGWPSQVAGYSMYIKP